jgi:hypothetical protein
LAAAAHLPCPSSFSLEMRHAGLCVAR